jgi:hypothetical protein
MRGGGASTGFTKLYEPPIPKHLIPTHNPFYNKQIFGVNQQTAYSDFSHKNAEDGAGFQTSPRSLLNWINSSNTKKTQKRMTNRIEYLK